MIVASNKIVKLSQANVIDLLLSEGADWGSNFFVIDILNKLNMQDFAAAINAKEAWWSFASEFKNQIHKFTPYTIESFLKAAWNNDVEEIEMWLKYGIDVDQLSPEGGSSIRRPALFLASSNNSVAAMRLLLDRGADVDAATPEGRLTALHEAAANGHVAAMQVLLDRGADVNAADARGRTPLHEAVSAAIVAHGLHPSEAADLAAIVLLLDAGAAADAAAAWGGTPLGMAAAAQRMAAVYGLANGLDEAVRILREARARAGVSGAAADPNVARGNRIPGGVVAAADWCVRAGDWCVRTADWCVCAVARFADWCVRAADWCVRATARFAASLGERLRAKVRRLLRSCAAADFAD